MNSENEASHKLPSTQSNCEARQVQESARTFRVSSKRQNASSKTLSGIRHEPPASQRQSLHVSLLRESEPKLMKLPDTLLPASHYATHFGVSEKEVEEHGKVVVAQTTTTYFALPVEALAALKELA